MPPPVRVLPAHPSRSLSIVQGWWLGEPVQAVVEVCPEPLDALAQGIVTACAHHVELEAIIRHVAESQALRPLSIAEVWALPLVLRIVLLEALASAVAIALPAEGSAEETAADEIVAACIRSLRTLEITDWKAFFEQVSETERILRQRGCWRQRASRRSVISAAKRSSHHLVSVASRRRLSRPC